ncbi:mechanosensitive ion channel [Candidatus Peregrinibacteria bacterium]|nr:mechanosensitive ion channel [Candidatus Peregrinibacteria bacterium]
MSVLNHILGIPTALAQVSNSAVNQTAQGTTDEFSKLIANFLAAIPLWIAAIIVGIISYVIALMVKRSIETKMAEKGIEEEHKEVQIVAGRSAYFIVIIIGITVSLSIVGIDLKPIVAAGAFGLGFALQDIIMNTISGMLILASRHYTIGDVIKVGSVVGRIMEIQTRATIIKAFDGTKVIVPNAELFKNVVISKTSNPYRKLSFIQGVGYYQDLKQVMDLTLAVVKNIPGVLAKPKPSVIFLEWDDSYILFKINVWIDSKGGKMIKVKNRVMMDITTASDEAGIDVPYPIQTIQLGQDNDYAAPEDEVAQKIIDIKKRLAEGKAAKVQFPAAASILAPQVAAQTPIESTPSITEKPQQPVLPTALETTPNSPGQNWLQQALSQQVAATQNQSVQSVPQTPAIDTTAQTSTETPVTVAPQVQTPAETPAPASPEPSAPSPTPLPTENPVPVSPVTPVTPSPEQNPTASV